MTEQVKTEAAAVESSKLDNKEIVPIRRNVVNARTAGPANRWTVRAAEIKKEKRRAHRRRINASNTPG